MARRLRLNSRMGILADDTEVAPALTGEQFAGPGSARVGYSEYNQRALLARWADHLERPITAAVARDIGGQDEVVPALEHLPSEDTAEVTGA
jgi:hypothetical protein